MSRVYLPTAEQMDETLKNLSMIAGVVGSKIDISTWKGIQNAVRAGIAPQVVPIGTQFRINHAVYGNMAYDVVAHDYFKSVTDENAHTMTLMARNLIPSLMYDNSEAFHYTTSLPADTYNFTIVEAYDKWGAGTYQFTTTVPLSGGAIQLGISGTASTALTSLKVRTYDSRYTTDATEECSITLGNGGTNLGTFGVELNHAHRVSYGSNNYKESAIRQFLNSDNIAGSVWTPQSIYDRPPSWVSSAEGFTRGLEDELLDVIGRVLVPCSANTTYEAPYSEVNKGSKYTVEDKFYLASQQELFGQPDGTLADDSVIFPFYGRSGLSRVKYANGVAAWWRLRSPNTWGAHDVRCVNIEGNSKANSAVSAVGIAPVFTIV